MGGSRYLSNGGNVCNDMPCGKALERFGVRVKGGGEGLE